MKYILIFFLLFSSLYAKDCYKDKVLDQFICYYKYFNTSNLYAPKENETYYQTKNGSIYALSDEIEVHFSAIGLIFSVIEDFDLELIDKKNEKTFLFKIKDKDKLFSVIRRLNDLTSIQRVIPQRERKFTTAEVQRRMEIAEKEQKRAVVSEKQKEIRKAKERAALKNSGASFKGNFLKGNK
jgi:hypothetical protein